MGSRSPAADPLNLIGILTPGPVGGAAQSLIIAMACRLRSSRRKNPFFLDIDPAMTEQAVAFSSAGAMADWA